MNIERAGDCTFRGNRLQKRKTRKFCTKKVPEIFPSRDLAFFGLGNVCFAGFCLVPQALLIGIFCNNCNPLFSLETSFAMIVFSKCDEICLNLGISLINRGTWSIRRSNHGKNRFYGSLQLFSAGEDFKNSYSWFLCGWWPSTCMTRNCGILWDVAAKAVARSGRWKRCSMRTMQWWCCSIARWSLCGAIWS